MILTAGSFPINCAGSIPYGYLRDAEGNTYTPDPETEDVVRMIFKKKLAGAGYP